MCNITSFLFIYLPIYILSFYLPIYPPLYLYICMVIVRNDSYQITIVIGFGVIFKLLSLCSSVLFTF